MPWTWAPRAKSQSWPHLFGLSVSASLPVPSRSGKVLGKAGGARRAAFDTELEGQALHLPVGTAPPRFRDSSRRGALPAGHDLTLIRLTSCLLPQTNSSLRTGSVSDPLCSQPLAARRCLINVCCLF